MRAVLMLLAVIAIAAIPAAAQQSSAAKAAKPAAASPAKSAATATAPVNINTATQAQLEALPGVGPKVAERILEFRQKNGNFKKIEDLMNVQGIGEKSFLKLKPLLTVTEKKADPSGV
jgi:competence protein ComEA